MKFLIQWFIGLSVCGLLTSAGADIPRTSSGKPDLSGNFDVASLTPYQRDPKFGDQLFMSSQEARKIIDGESKINAAASAQSDPNREAPPEGGDGTITAGGGVGGYNFFWIDRGNDIFKKDGKFRTSIITDPANGRLPELTEAGKKRRAEARPYIFKNTGTAWWLDQPGPGPYDNPESLPLSERCLYVAPASVPVRPILYNNLKTIVQTDSHVMIHVEWMHDARIIRLNSEHAPDAVKSLNGDSIGHWQGDTLVVETTNFLSAPNVASDLVVVERFSRINETALNYHFTVYDSNYEKPYSGEFPWPQTDSKLYEYACHEGNYSMGNILRGARLLESEALAEQASAGGH
ncbi:MAG: hypothetical protein VYE04_09160 [Pseudomonadota bacterium]|nr:hypothetical protein [Pseudomonadota bacterium]